MGAFREGDFLFGYHCAATVDISIFHKILPEWVQDSLLFGSQSTNFLLARTLGLLMESNRLHIMCL